MTSRRTTIQSNDSSTVSLRGGNDNNRNWWSKFFSVPNLIFFLALFITSIPMIYLTFFTHLFDSVHFTTRGNANLRNKIQPPPPSPPMQQWKANQPVPSDTTSEERQEPQLSAESSQVLDANGKLILPGAMAHPILALSDEQLQNTPVDLLMADYGESDGGGSCFKDFGNTLVTRWRETKRSYCSKKTQIPQQLNSQIDCYLVHQTRHHGNGDNLCLMENVALDLSIFDHAEVMTPVIQSYVRTKHMKQPYPPFPKGFLKGDCEPDNEVFKDMYLPGWNAELVTRPYQKITATSANLCKEWIDHPVLLTERDTFANFFHDSEDFVNVFLAMAILQFKPKDLQIFLMDLYPEGPFWEMWSEVYSRQYPALTAFDLKTKYPRTEDGSPYHVCFKSLAVGIYGPAAPTTIASWDTPCVKTALVRAYSDFVIRSLNLHPYTHYAQATPSKTITITYMSRRPSKEWPEKKYCNDTHSFFLCDYWREFGPRQLGRMVSNDGDVIRALKRLETNEEEFLKSLPEGVKIKVQAVDYNILSFKEQIKIDLETDIMLGPHGAGLMHNIFMRDRAILIELFIDGSSANRHFHNFAHWFGRQYEGIPMSNPINTNELLDIMKRNIKKIDFDSY